MTGEPRRGEPAPLPTGVRVRPATEADLAHCGTIWRDALNDYMSRLNQPEVPAELAPIGRLHAHLLASDGERFMVATRGAGHGAARDAGDATAPSAAAEEPPGTGGPPIAFAAATRRDGVWFLSMLFVRPEEQGAGLGRAMLRRILPRDGCALATATDSAQPISNALYASHGIVPQMPLLSLIGEVTDAACLGDLPAGIAAVPFEELAAGPPGAAGHAALVAMIDALDAEIAGFTHPQDHRFLRGEGRQGFLYQGPGGAALAYGYASAAGRVGPVAVRDEALLPAVIGHLVRAVPPRGASAVWAPGHAGALVAALLRAGLRIDGFPVLLCWSRPFADFSRYVPISPGLL